MLFLLFGRQLPFLFAPKDILGENGLPEGDDSAGICAKAVADSWSGVTASNKSLLHIPWVKSLRATGMTIPLSRRAAPPRGTLRRLRGITAVCTLPMHRHGLPGGAQGPEPEQAPLHSGPPDAQPPVLKTVR